MFSNKKLFTLLISLWVCNLFGTAPFEQNTSSISTEALQHFKENSAAVKKMLMIGLDLSSKKLGYLYGSNKPENKGMDCSGAINYILSTYGLKEVPRSSELLYQWATHKGKFYEVKNSNSSENLLHLKPGDLLFWNKTYKNSSSVNASHTMIYLGKNLQGKHLMLGSSNGRTYQGEKVYGVSVFDFKLPKKNSRAKFIGYSCTPEISC